MGTKALLATVAATAALCGFGGAVGGVWLLQDELRGEVGPSGDPGAVGSPGPQGGAGPQGLMGPRGFSGESASIPSGVLVVGPGGVCPFGTSRSSGYVVTSLGFAVAEELLGTAPLCRLGP